jgi:hypothetical protein
MDIRVGLLGFLTLAIIACTPMRRGQVSLSYDILNNRVIWEHCLITVTDPAIYLSTYTLEERPTWTYDPEEIANFPWAGPNVSGLYTLSPPTEGTRRDVGPGSKRLSAPSPGHTYRKDCWDTR